MMVKRPQPKISEQQVQKDILDYLKFMKIDAWKNHSTGIKKPDGGWIPVGKKGASDILGVLPTGRFLAIEVKRPHPRKPPSEDQQKFIDMIKKNNGVAFVAYCLDDVIEKLGFNPFKAI